MTDLQAPNLHFMSPFPLRKRIALHGAKQCKQKPITQRITETLSAPLSDSTTVMMVW